MFRFIVCILLAFSYSVALASSCRPAVNSDEPQYMIGYGSLIEKTSRTHSAKGAFNAYPILVKGFERGWIQPAKITHLGIEFLGVVPKAKASFNAVYYRMNASDLEATDQREYGYCRVQVPQHQLVSLSGGLPTGEYWLYVTPKEKVQWPSEEYPIVQSYVDVVLTGCIHIGQEFHLSQFAEQCVTTTKGWSEHWINDRELPRRPWVHVPEALQIDHLLEVHAGKAWKHMQLKR